jgi:hypothetical protein
VPFSHKAYTLFSIVVRPGVEDQRPLVSLLKMAPYACPHENVLTPMFFFGNYDFALIVEMPDNISAVKSIKTTPLLSATETMEAMKKASAAGYRPATSK